MLKYLVYCIYRSLIIFKSQHAIDSYFKIKLSTEFISFCKVMLDDVQQLLIKIQQIKGNKT